MRNNWLIAPLALFCTAANAQMDAHGRAVEGSIHLSPPARASQVEPPKSSPNAGAWELLPFVARAMPSSPDALAIGDVTGDRRPDVVVTTIYAFDRDNDFHLFLFPQGPDGTLQSPSKSPYLQVPVRTSVAVLDLDGEYGNDVVVGGYTGLTIFRATAVGRLARTEVLATQETYAMVAVDFDQSGREDLASVGSQGSGRLHRNLGDGSLLSSTWAARAQAENSLARGDLDGDGRLDVALASNDGVSPFITLYRNTGSGLAEMQSLVGTCPGWIGDIAGIAIGDVNADGHADVIASSGGNRPNTCIQVYRALAGGGYAAPVYYPSYDIPETLRAADINRDGLTDILVLHGGWYALGVYLQQRDGTLAAERRFYVPYASHYNVHGMEIADLTADGCPDVAIADYNYGLVTLQGAGCVQIDEPRSSGTPLPAPIPANANCPAGFFTATIADGPGAGLTAGTFGMELLLDDPGTRVLAGGLNFGGLIDAGQPGFAGFAIANAANEPQQLTLSLTGSPSTRSDGSMPVRVRVSRRTASTSSIVFETTTSITLGTPYVAAVDLAPAFYEATVTPLSGIPGGAAEGQFYFSLTTRYSDRPGGGFQGGAVVGGYHATHPFGGVSGFAGFCLATPHSASARVLSAPSYGASGAMDLRLRILDEQRNLILAEPPE